MGISLSEFRLSGCYDRARRVILLFGFNITYRISRNSRSNSTVNSAFSTPDYISFIYFILDTMTSKQANSRQVWVLINFAILHSWKPGMLAYEAKQVDALVR